MKERRSFSCVVGVSPVACGVRAARCQSRRVLGVSRVCAQSPRREESRVIASSVVSRRLSPRREESRVTASSVVSRRLSSRCASSAARRRESSCSVSVASCAESCRCQSRLVVRRPAARRLVVRRPAAGVSRVVRSACESRPFFLSFQTRWMTFFFVLY